MLLSPPPTPEHRHAIPPPVHPPRSRGSGRGLPPRRRPRFDVDHTGVGRAAHRPRRPRHLGEGAPRREGRDHHLPPGPHRRGPPRRHGLGARRVLGGARERVGSGLGVRRRPLRHRHRDRVVGAREPGVRPRLAPRRAAHAPAALCQGSLPEQCRRGEAARRRLPDRPTRQHGLRRGPVRAGPLRPQRRRFRWALPEQPHRHPAGRLARGAAARPTRRTGSCSTPWCGATRTAAPPRTR